MSYAATCNHPPVIVAYAGVALSSRIRQIARPWATIAVRVASNGKASNDSIIATSGSSIFDTAALKAAKQMQYQPAKSGCKPTSGTIAFNIGIGRNVYFTNPADHGPTLIASVTVATVPPPSGKGTAVIRVKINTEGSVSAVSLIKSSGDQRFDKDTLRSAARSAYLPAVKNFQPTSSDFQYNASFSSNQ